MIDRTELLEIARARLRDAEILLGAARYDCAVYLCGYAVEIKLKARICRTLRWSGYPQTSGEFQNSRSLRTHDLDVLLRFSGVEQKIKPNYLVEWSTVGAWDPAVRYRRIGSATKQDAEAMISSAKVLLRELL